MTTSLKQRDRQAAQLGEARTARDVLRSLRMLMVVVGAAGVLVPIAQASERPNDRAGQLGVGSVAGSIATPDAFERAVRRHDAAITPDAFERAVAIHVASTPPRPDDRAGSRGPGEIMPQTLDPDITAPDGLRWSDASVGAGAMLGALLLAAAVGLTVRRGRALPF
jgi:hypothetical protein